MDWISVKERLPEKSGSYLVCTEKSKAFTAHWWADHKVWSPHYPGKHITHWMELPKTPWEVEHAKETLN